MPSFNPSEAFSWGQRAFHQEMVVPGHDPAVAKFPHLFVPVEGEQVDEEPAKPVKRVGRPPKAKPAPEVEGD